MHARLRPGRALGRASDGALAAWCPDGALSSDDLFPARHRAAEDGGLFRRGCGVGTWHPEEWWSRQPRHTHTHVTLDGRYVSNVSRTGADTLMYPVYPDAKGGFTTKTYLNDSLMYPLSPLYHIQTDRCVYSMPNQCIYHLGVVTMQHKRPRGSFNHWCGKREEMSATTSRRSSCKRVYMYCPPFCIDCVIREPMGPWWRAAPLPENAWRFQPPCVDTRLEIPTNRGD